MISLILFLAVASALAGNLFEGDVVLRITPKTDSEVQFLRQLADSGKFELDIWRDVTHVGQNVDIHVKASDVDAVKKMLTEKHIIFSNMIDNLQTVVDNEKLENEQNAFFGDFHASYHSYDEIIREMDSYVRSNPSIITKGSVGRTYEGRTMYYLKYSLGSRKPAIWIDGGIHAREWISPATVMYFADYLRKNINDREIQSLLSKYDFYILPVFNADGYEYTRNGNRMWRKTRSKNTNTRKPWCIGTDPNRNWDYGFGGAGTSTDPCRDTYHGSKAFSEIEVKNVASFLRRLGNVKSYWNVHAYSQLVLTPWSYTTRLPTDYSEIQRVGQIFANSVRNVGGISYRVGPPSRILYAVGGGSMDWTYAVLRIKYSYALELRDTGRYGFVLPPYYIKISGKETTRGFLDAIKAMK